MPDRESYRKLLYDYEVLRARLEIREYYVKTIIREIYENIGQVLSLVRVQLSTLETGPETHLTENENASSPGHLVGSVIRELRIMCRRFYPEENLDASIKLTDTIAELVKGVYPRADCTWERIDGIDEIETGKGLLLLAISLELLELIAAERDNLLYRLVGSCTGKTVDLIFIYRGTIIDASREKKQGTQLSMSVADRADLAGGNLKIKKINDDYIKIKLVIPIT